MIVPDRRAGYRARYPSADDVSGVAPCAVRRRVRCAGAWLSAEAEFVIEDASNRGEREADPRVTANHLRMRVVRPQLSGPVCTHVDELPYEGSQVVGRIRLFVLIA